MKYILKNVLQIQLQGAFLFYLNGGVYDERSIKARPPPCVNYGSDG